MRSYLSIIEQNAACELNASFFRNVIPLATQEGPIYATNQATNLCKCFCIKRILL